MKKLLFVSMFLWSGMALSATYNLTGSCTDPTPTGPAYTPLYNWEIRVNGGAVTAYNDKPTCTLAATATANAGDTIEARAQHRNTQGPIIGAWTTWFTATAPLVPTVPVPLTGVVITVTPQ